jgi:hypothetical protein
VPRQDDTLFRWLGRQIGHVRHAVKPKPPEPIYRHEKVEERPHPTRPGIVLRRTTTDEAVQEQPGEAPRPAPDASSK